MIARRLALALTGVLLAAGCGATDSSGSDGDPSSRPAPSASSSPTPERVFTADELAAALPRSSQVPTGKSKTTTCPGSDYCSAGQSSVSIDLAVPVPAEQQEQLASSVLIQDFVFVSVTAHPDERAATDAVASARKVLAKYEGRFDVPVEESGKTFTPGEKGTGTLTDRTIDGWTGYESSRLSVYSDGDGPADGPSQTVQLTVAKGSAQLIVNVVVLSDPRGPGFAEKTARQVATDYIARLG